MCARENAVCTLLILAVFETAVPGQSYSITPVGASGTHVINGQDIVLDSGGQRVFFELQIAGWGPSQLKSWQVGIDSSDYDGGVDGQLAPALQVCAANADCTTTLGAGSLCGTLAAGECTAGFLDTGRADYVFASVPDLPGVDISNPDYRYGATTLTDPVVDPGQPEYCGTLVLDVSADAIGGFTVLLKPAASQMQDQDGMPIPIAEFLHATVTIPCVNDADCDDGSACTVDSCGTDGICVLAGCDDGLPCTADNCVSDQCVFPVNPGSCLIEGGCVAESASNPANDCELCDPSLAIHDWSIKPDGADCDDGLFCSLDETCQGGVCVAAGQRDCDDGIPCTQDACDEVSDTCVQNPDNTQCTDDGLFCNGPEVCTVGAGCQSAGSPCTGPCDEVLDTCSCDAPVVRGVGSRYLKITMSGDSFRAIRIQADCPEAPARYVLPPTAFDIDKDGAPDENVAQVGDTPPSAESFLSPGDWGELYMYGEYIYPGQTYQVWSDCGSVGAPGLSEVASATTCAYGDTVGDIVDSVWEECDGGLVRIQDIIAVLECFIGSPRAAPIYQLDLAGTGPDGFTCSADLVADMIPDVVTAVDAFRSLPQPCTGPCP